MCTERVAKEAPDRNTIGGGIALAVARLESKAAREASALKRAKPRRR